MARIRRHRATDEPAAGSPVPRPWRIAPVWWLGAAVLIAAAGWLPKLLAPRDNVAWRIDQQRLSVLDSRGNPVWSHDFDFVLQPADYRRQGSSAVQPNLGEFVDLDNDGRKEFLFLAVSTDEYKKAFYCFNGDGSVRFSVVPGHTITRTIRFGEDDFAPPFGVARYMVEDESAGRKSVLVISYDPTWFPSVVQKYSSSGRLLGEYWNPGRLWEAAIVQSGGRRLLFVGGINNEFHAGSLSVLDWDRPSGAGPATNPHYQCRNCPAGAPLAYYVFPETEVARAISAWPTVWRVHQDTPDRVSAQVLQTREPLAEGGPPGLIGATIYGFDDRLTLRSAEFVEGYRAVHSALEALGRLDHRFGPRDERQLLPVRRWNGAGFENVLPAAP